MDRFEENLSMMMNMERDADRQRAADHEELVSKVQGQIDSLTDSMANLNTEIFIIKMRIKTQKRKVMQAMVTAQDWSVRLDDRTGECDQNAAVWENFYANIQAEIQTAT